MFLIIARYWNDMDWLEASLGQIDYWNADKVVVCEGCWDSKFPARSIDGTVERLKEHCTENRIYLKNLRDNDYRTNQANTSNKAMEIAGAKPGDYVLVIDCDHFYFKEDIDLMKEKMGSYDYSTYKILNFNTSIGKCWICMDNSSAKMPYKLLKDAQWMPTNQLHVGGKFYHELNAEVWNTNIRGYHYEGLRDERRYEEKYSVADRKSPKIWKNGIKIKQQKSYSGFHPEFVTETLRNKGYNA